VPLTKPIQEPKKSGARLAVNRQIPQALDSVIIGAGPGGLMLGAALKQLGSQFHIFDKGRIGESWLRIPKHLIVTVRPTDFFGMEHAKKTPGYSRRDQVMRFIHQYAEDFELLPHISEHFGVRNFFYDAAQGLYSVLIRHATSSLESVVYASTVIAAMGIFHHPRKLGVPGEDEFPDRIGRLEEGSDLRIANNLKDKRIVIIGGGNTALRLIELIQKKGVKSITMVMSPDDIVWSDNTGNATHADPKYRPMVNRLRSDTMQATEDQPRLFIQGGSAVERFEAQNIVVKVGQRFKSLPYDRCFLCIGYKPALDFLDQHGVGIDHGKVMMNPYTLQALDPKGRVMPGLYLLGVDPVSRGGATISSALAKDGVGQMASQARIIAAQINSFHKKKPQASGARLSYGESAAQARIDLQAALRGWWNNPPKPKRFNVSLKQVAALLMAAGKEYPDGKFTLETLRADINAEAGVTGIQLTPAQTTGVIQYLKEKYYFQNNGKVDGANSAYYSLTPSGWAEARAIARELSDSAGTRLSRPKRWLLKTALFSLFAATVLLVYIWWRFS
jgi:thioredoxin reductase